MNRQLVHLFGVVLLLFALLIVWTSRWTVFDASALQSNSLNKLGHYAVLKVRPGRVLADGGQVLARPVRGRGGTWGQRYPYGSLFGQVVGYDSVSEGSSAGLQRFDSEWLFGRHQSTLSSVFGPLGSQRQVGDDLETTLDPRAQLLARSLLAGRTGSVVAIVPGTGAIKVLYSNPGYDDNDPPPKGPGTEYFNALQGEYPPGSTFKVVTTAAALDSGRYTPNSLINGNSPLTVSGVPLENDNNQSWGQVSLTKALTYSINTVYAQVGESVGRATMDTYMRRFGFYSPPPLDFPKDELTISGERSPRGRLIPVTSDQVDLGRTAIGQADLAVTPFQMAMVASAVANDGTLMTPRLVRRVVNPDGTTAAAFAPTVFSHVMKPSSALELRQMMSDVVEEGTGTAANLEGLKVAGKTGTATIQTGSDLDDAWFIGMAPVSRPRIAVAVELTSIPNGYGGTYAAPVAARLMRLLISEGQ